MELNCNCQQERTNFLNLIFHVITTYTKSLSLYQLFHLCALLHVNVCTLCIHSGIKPRSQVQLLTLYPMLFGEYNIQNKDVSCCLL